MRHLPLLCLAAFLSTPSSFADERFDHRGSLGLVLESGAELKDLVTSSGESDRGPRLDFGLGGTMAIGHDGNELLFVARSTVGGTVIDWSGHFGYRSYFGPDRLRTFFDLDLSLHLTPVVTFGPRAGIGLQYELSSVLGAYFAVAAQLGFGGALRFNAEALVGLQLRSYLLE